MDENLSTVNAGQEGNVDLQDTNQQNVQSEPVNAGNQGFTNQGNVQQQTQQQTPEQNAMYANIRREAETRAKDATIRELSGGQFNSYAEYQDYVRQQNEAAQAQQLGVDPAFLNKVNSLESELTTLRQEREANALANDPVHGGYFKQWEGDIKQLAQAAGCSLRTAYSVMLERNLPNLISGMKTAGQQDAITKLTQTDQTSPGSLSSEAAGSAKSVSNMSKSDFAKLQEEVLRGERKTL